MAQLRDIVFDCGHAAPLAGFWASVLDDYSVAPYDDAELQRLRDMGIPSPEGDPTVLVEGPGAGPRLWFQTVPEPKATKNRVHLDLSCRDFDSELERLKGLGAVMAGDQPNESLVVLFDPEGNEFCLLR
jgi:hypothetical protein